MHLSRRVGGPTTAHLLIKSRAYTVETRNRFLPAKITVAHLAYLIHVSAEKKKCDRVSNPRDDTVSLSSPVHAASRVPLKLTHEPACSALAHTCVHAHAHALSHACTCIHMHAHACTCMCILHAHVTCACTCTCDLCMRCARYMCMHMHMHIHAHAHACACACACACDMCTPWACTCTRTYMHMDTHAHKVWMCIACTCAKVQVLTSAMSCVDSV